MGKLSDTIRRSGATEPYPDAVATKQAVAALEKKHLGFSINATDLSAGTPQELIATCDGAITAIYGTVAVAIVTGGGITVKVGTTDVAGASLTAADAAVVGTRYSDTTLTNDGTELVKKGDRIQIVPAAAFNGGGAVNGFLEITQSA